ncbi:hypothetical protein RUESEDTHA_00842 [Ruegeria sp. THAF57]|nr:hypothetical protein RUESEDTHA_00842 [Ruegeria sp. THAF57]
MAQVQFQKFALGLSNSTGAGAFLGNLLSLSGGGYTGDSGKYEPAGIVLRGEYVVQAAQVRKPGVRPLLEAINRGAPGYATGGYLSRPAEPPASAEASPLTDRLNLVLVDDRDPRGMFDTPEETMALRIKLSELGVV